MSDEMPCVAPYDQSWAHCPNCSRKTRWRVWSDGRHECICSYMEGDVPASLASPDEALGKVTPIPMSDDIPHDEPVTRLERIVTAILAGKLTAFSSLEVQRMMQGPDSYKLFGTQVVEAARYICVEMARLEKEYGA